MDEKLLGIYLNDHYAGAVGGIELAKRCRGSNSGTDLGRFLDGLVDEIQADQDTLGAVMDALEIGRDPVKRLAGWTAEKLGRLKLNGTLISYSPLSRLVEMEALALGVSGKEALWRALSEIEDERLARFDFTALAERAAGQRAQIEHHRLAAARTALG